MNNVVERLQYGTKTKENNNNKVSEIPCYCDLDSDRSEGKRFITELHSFVEKNQWSLHYVKSNFKIPRKCYIFMVVTIHILHISLLAP